MDGIVKYAVNSSMEGVMIVILGFILLACTRQKRHFSTSTPLIYLTSIVLMVLINHVVTRSLELFYPESYLLMSITYILDYFYGYFAGFAFYLYVETLAIEGYKLKGIKYNGSKTISRCLIVFGLISTLVYAIGIIITALYSIENGVIVINIPAYIVMHIVVKMACYFALFSIVKHKNAIKSNEAIILACFIFVPMAFIVIDETFSLCISYMTLAFITVVLFIRIDVQRELLFQEQERSLAEAQTEIMLSQMQPHFLYNVLTTISALCEKQNALEARDVVNRFADYFRVNLDSLGKEKTIPFSKELEHIKTYLWLEKVRFEDSLNINYEIGPTHFMVPSLSIQPIVENAVKHGILRKDTPGTLTIKTSQTDSDYLIIIEDDGIGFDINEKIEDGKTHVGIENVGRRLELVCGGRIDVQSKKGKGTVVTIAIPKGA